MTQTKKKGAKAAPSKQSKRPERTAYETPEITRLNMSHIFVFPVTKLVFPAMQRTYSWGVEQLERFFNNLYMDRYINQDTSAIGMFELYISDASTRNRKELYIFNGQQRIVTMFLILCNIRDILNRLKVKEKKKYEAIISQINLLFFENKLPGGTYSHFKMLYEGSEDMNILLRYIADPHSFPGSVKETEGTQKLRDANQYTKKWLNSHFEDDYDTIYDFAKFLLNGVFFAGQYHSEIKRAESAFIESNLIQVHLTQNDLLRGKLISYVNTRKQIQMAHTFNTIDRMLRDNEFFTTSKKTRINEILLKHSISINFAPANKSIDVMDFVFNTNEKKAQEIVDKYFEWAKSAVQTRNDIRTGYEYMFLKMIANQKVFSWTKAVVCNMVISRGETQDNRKVLLDLMITFLAMYYGNTANINTESVANDFCNHMKKHPTASWDLDLNRFYEILAVKINEGGRSRRKQVSENKQAHVSTVLLTLSEQLKNFSYQKRTPDRHMMRLVLCFVEAILQHEIGGENLYIAFKRIYDNHNVKIKQISTVNNNVETDFHNKLGNVTLSYEAKKPLKLYINSNFASEIEKMSKKTRNLTTVLESIKGLVNFADVKNVDEAKCKKRLDFIVAAFRHYWKPETLVKLQATSRERAAAARKDGVKTIPLYTSRMEDIESKPVTKQLAKVG